MSEIIERVKKNVIEGLKMIDQIAINNNIEIWKLIDGYLNYQVSSHARVRNTRSEKVLQPDIRSGYYYVNLSQGKKRKKHYIHRLMAQAFMCNKQGNKYIDHRDNNKLNNTLVNLRWVTSQQNNFNSSLRKDNSSGTKGVSWNKEKKKWGVYISDAGKLTKLGYYTDLKEAKKVRQKKAKELFGEYVNSCEL